MRGRSNPFVEEGIRAYASWEALLRSYLLLPVVLGLVLLVVWPRGTLETAIRSSGLVDPFTAVAAGFLIVLIYLSARQGAEDFSPSSLVQLREYVTLTPVPLFSVVAGKAAFAAGHTLFLLVLGAPFLLASMAVSGITFGQALPVFAVIGASGLCARMCGLLVLALVGDHAMKRDAILLPCVALCFVITFLLLPAVNPLSAVLAATSRSQAPGAMSPAVLCGLLGLGASALLALAVFIVLRAARARARTVREAKNG